MASHQMMRNYLDMVTSGKVIEAQAYYGDDVRIHVKGHNMISGDYVGHDGYTAAMQRMMGALDSMEVEEHDLLVSDDHAVVLSVWHVSRGGRQASLNHVIVYHTTDDEITEMWIIPEDSEQDAAILS